MINSLDRAGAIIRDTGIIAIVRGHFDLAEMLKIGEALWSAHISVMEITLNSRGALSAVAPLRQHLSQMLVGVGTVRSVLQVNQAIEAGAQFIVSPSFDAASVARSQALGVLHLPGVMTPTEAQTAFAAGCRMLKLFPADSLGPAYLKALRAPLDDIEFVPTGGVAVENVGHWRRAGAVAVAIGSALVSDSMRGFEEVHRRAKLFREAWDGAQ